MIPAWIVQQMDQPSVSDGRLAYNVRFAADEFAQAEQVTGHPVAKVVVAVRQNGMGLWLSRST